MIDLKDTIKTAKKSLFINKGRTILTILGIVIGISAIIIVMSIGDSAQGLILNQVQAFGPENVFVNPGKPSGPFDVAGATLSTSLTMRDVESLKNKSNAPDAIAVNPSVTGFMAITRESEARTTTVWGNRRRRFRHIHHQIERGPVFHSGGGQRQS